MDTRAWWRVLLLLLWSPIALAVDADDTLLGNDADMAPEGATLAYTVMPPMMFQALRQWKGYRGGSAARHPALDAILRPV